MMSYLVGTICNWLHICGFRVTEAKKGIQDANFQSIRIAWPETAKAHDEEEERKKKKKKKKKKEKEARKKNWNTSRNHKNRRESRGTRPNNLGARRHQRR